MRLYRIKRKEDNKYLVSADHRLRQWSNFKGCFNSSGAFWKRIDNVKAHINVLCSEYDRREEYSGVHRYTIFNRKSFHPERALLYQVECLDVSVDKAELIEAKEFLK